MAIFRIDHENKAVFDGERFERCMGLSSGVPDLILDYPAGVYHGLRIELKYGKNIPSDEQKQWLLRLQDSGYFAAIAWSASTAIALLTEYMNLKPSEKMAEDCDAMKTRYGVPALK